MQQKLVVVLVCGVFALLLVRQSKSQAPRPESPSPIVIAPVAPRPIQVVAPGTGTNAFIELPPPAVPPKPQKNIWSIQIEQVDGRSVIHATVDKKSMIDIKCDSARMETQEGVLQAIGKVAITERNLHYTCDKLTIHLHEKLLILNGNVEVADKDRILTASQLRLRWPNAATKTETRTETVLPGRPGDAPPNPEFEQKLLEALKQRLPEATTKK